MREWLVILIILLAIGAVFLPQVPINSERANLSTRGNIYYVDFENGNDSNDGLSPDSAWKHAPGDNNAEGVPASTLLKPGDTVMFKGGVIYHGTITVDGRFGSGNNTAPIVFKGDGWHGPLGKRAILDGSSPITGNWTRCNSSAECGGNPNWQHIYYVDVPETNSFQTGFYQDGKFLWYSQDPNPGDPFYYDRIKYFRVVPYGDTNITITNVSVTDPRYFTQEDPHYWDGAYVAVWRVPNVVVIRKITSYDPVNHTVYFENIDGSLYTDRDEYYTVLNHPSMIDYPGEFYFDETQHRLYLWPRGDDIYNSTFSVRTLTTGFFVQEKLSNIVIEGFNIQHYTLGIRVIPNGGEPPENVTVRNNKIEYLKSNDWYGIQLSGKNLTAENNTLFNCQRAVGILAGGWNIKVMNNTIRRTSRQGIWFMGAHNSTIFGNTIYDIHGTHSNGISIYVYSSNITVVNNRVFDANSPITFEQSENLTFINNIAIGPNENNVNEWGSEVKGTVEFYNNVFVLNSRNASLNIGRGNARYIVKNNIIDGMCYNDKIVHNYNIYTGLEWCQDELQFNTSEFLFENLSDIFVNPFGYDFHLKSGSPAIDNGTNLSSLFNFDIDMLSRPQGSGWDIGACEYVAPENDTYLPWVNIISPNNGTELHHNYTLVIWHGEDIGSGIHYYEVKIDDGPWIGVGLNTSFNFTNLEPGTHIIEVRAVDYAGNYASDKVEIEYLTVPELNPLVILFVIFFSYRKLYIQRK